MLISSWVPYQLLESWWFFFLLSLKQSEGLLQLSYMRVVTFV